MINDEAYDAYLFVMQEAANDRGLAIGPVGVAHTHYSDSSS